MTLETLLLPEAGFLVMVKNNCKTRCITSLLFRINSDKDKQQKRESPQRGTAITDERQRDANDWYQSDGHADVDDQMEEQHRGHSVAIHPHKGALVPLRQLYDADDQGEEESENGNAADKAPLLADAAEDEVGALLRHKVELGLRAVEVAFPCKTTRTDGNL